MGVCHCVKVGDDGGFDDDLADNYVCEKESDETISVGKMMRMN